MRPIDAEALMKCFSLKSEPGAYFPYITIRDLFTTMDSLPTITLGDLRPKGEWIEQEDFNLDTYYDCSVCGESFCLIDGSPTDNLFKFCPNCGAKMGGGE